MEYENEQRGYDGELIISVRLKLYKQGLTTAR